MKNFPDNLRSGRGFVRAGAAVGLVALLAVPAAAQQYPSTATGDEPAPVQPGPVDLLATIQDNAMFLGLLVHITLFLPHALSHTTEKLFIIKLRAI